MRQICIGIGNRVHIEEPSPWDMARAKFRPGVALLRGKVVGCVKHQHLTEIIGEPFCRDQRFHGLVS
jgi:hypothetical protein